MSLSEASLQHLQPLDFLWPLTLLRHEPPRAPLPHPSSPSRLPGSMAIILSGALVQTLSPWRVDAQVSFTGCCLGPVGSDPSSMDQKLVRAVWLRPHLLVNLHRWFPQVSQAQPFHVKHHHGRVDPPAQLHRTERVLGSDDGSSQEDPPSTVLPPPPGCPQHFPNRQSPSRV